MDERNISPVPAGFAPRPHPRIKVGFHTHRKKGHGFYLFPLPEKQGESKTTVPLPFYRGSGVRSYHAEFPLRQYKKTCKMNSKNNQRGFKGGK